MNEKLIEIVCSACGADTFVRREPVYDGFTKTGEKFFCASCGHEFAGEHEIPYKEKKKISVFTQDDASKKVRVFREDEKGKNCRYCKHYIVNPFVQRCTLHMKEVEATDFCGDFEKKEEKSKGSNKSKKYA